MKRKSRVSPVTVPSGGRKGATKLVINKRVQVSPSSNVKAASGAALANLTRKQLELAVKASTVDEYLNLKPGRMT